MFGVFVLYSLFYKDCSGYNQYNQGFRLGTKIGSNHANLSYFVYQKQDYMLSLIREISKVSLDMKKEMLFTLTIIIASSAVFSGLMFTAPGIFDAYAGISLDPDNAANSIIIHVTREGSKEIRTYDSFSRLGFVSGENNFLLESVPSLDKIEFYKFIKDSLDDKNNLDVQRINIAIDIYSGNGKLIETLEYDKCVLEEYFVHSVDSLGKIQFIEGEDKIEIREVTKFECSFFTISLDRFGNNLIEEIIDEKDLPKFAKEGEIKYNPSTATYKQYQNGEWVDIRKTGDPRTQR